MEMYSLAVRMAELKQAERDERLARAALLREAAAGVQGGTDLRRWAAAFLIALADNLAPPAAAGDPAVATPAPGR